MVSRKLTGSIFAEVEFYQILDIMLVDVECVSGTFHGKAPACMGNEINC